jgi:hypothetical protein
MQEERSDKGNDEKIAVHIREQKAETLMGLIHEIRRRVTEEPSEMRRSRSGFQIDVSMKP